MRILHIDETFHPKYGYHTSIISRIESQNKEDEVYILTVQADKLYPVYKSFNDYTYDLKYDDEFQTDNLHIVRLPIWKYISNRAIYKRGFRKAIKEINPDIIYCHLLESYITMKLILKPLNYPIIFDSHMLKMASNNKLSKLFNSFFKHNVTKKIIKNDYLVLKTQDDNYVNEILGVPENQTRFVSFGTDMSIFKPDLEIRKEMRNKLDIPEDSFVVVYTGKLTEDKGGKFFANAIKEKFEGNVTFVIVGYIPKETEEIFKQSENRIIFIPKQFYTDLHYYYQLADVCLFPKQCSLSFYDAQACGLPVIAEDNNVNCDRLSHNNGKTFVHADIPSFREAISFFVKMDKKELKEYSNNSYEFVKNGYSYDTIVANYRKIYETEIEKFNNRKKK